MKPTKPAKKKRGRGVDKGRRNASGAKPAPKELKKTKAKKAEKRLKREKKTKQLPIIENVRGIVTAPAHPPSQSYRARMGYLYSLESLPIGSCFEVPLTRWEDPEQKIRGVLLDCNSCEAKVEILGKRKTVITNWSPGTTVRLVEKFDLKKEVALLITGEETKNGVSSSTPPPEKVVVNGKGVKVEKAVASVEKVKKSLLPSKRDGNSRDKFGYLVGTQASDLCATLSFELKSMQQMQKEAKASSTGYCYCRKLIERGLVEKVDNKFRLTKEGGKLVGLLKKSEEVEKKKLKKKKKGAKVS